LREEKTHSSTDEALVLYLFLFRGILGSVRISAPVAVMLWIERESRERKKLVSQRELKGTTRRATRKKERERSETHRIVSSN